MYEMDTRGCKTLLNNFYSISHKLWSEADYWLIKPYFAQFFAQYYVYDLKSLLTQCMEL